MKKNITKLVSTKGWSNFEGRYTIIKEFFKNKPIDLTSSIDLEGTPLLVAMSVISYFKQYGLIDEFENYLDKICQD